jgi:hypothetical protein
MNYSSLAFHRELRRVFLSLLIGVAAISAVNAAPQSEKKETLSRARQRYYNLRRAGLIEFQANIKPNWDLLLTGVDLKSSARNLFNGLQFTVSIDSASKLRMDHHADVTPPDQKSAEGFEKMFKGMDEAVSSFFGTWSIFMLTSPFPEIGSDYELKESALQYYFSHKEPGMEVLTITDRDFMISEIKVSGRDFNASVKPVLEKTAEGFILKGYAATYQTLTGARNTSVKALLEYEELRGLQLLHKVNLDTVFEGKPAQMEWLFTDYQVKVR